MKVKHTGKDGKTEVMKVGRNNPCPCGSGKKFKYCHGPHARRWTDQVKEKQFVEGKTPEEKPAGKEEAAEADAEKIADAFEADGPEAGSGEPEGD